MAKKDPAEYTVEEKLKSLYQLQTILSEIDKIKILRGELPLEVKDLEDEIVGVIIFKEGCFRIESYGMCGAFTQSGFDECGGGWGVIDCEPIDWYYIKDMEVIGNIHDNPELLEVE